MDFVLLWLIISRGNDEIGAAHHFCEYEVFRFIVIGKI